MDHLQFIKNRRSYRSFKTLKVEKEKLEEIVYCGLVAPSGMNTQGIYFTVISDEGVLCKLKEMVGREFFYNAPALIVVHCDEDYKYAYTDGSCAMENMYLACEALGLRSCWINQLKDYTDHEVLKELKLSKQCIVGALAVGYSDEVKSERKLNLDRVKYL